MNPKKFYAPNSRDALRKVRETLGPNAIVLSNRPISNGVEVIAVPDSELAGMTEPSKDALPSAKRPQQSEVNRITAERNDAITENIQSTIPPLPMESDSYENQSSMQLNTDRLLAEIADMKRLLENQLSIVTWGDLKHRDPARVQLSKHLLNCGFSPTLTRALIEALPPKSTFEAGLQWIRSVLNRNLNAIENGTDFVDQGGVYALLGPTGVGKTTTLAKLAARYVLRHGTSKLALLTMDTYRIGAHDQLKVYGKILGVPVYSVRDAPDLEVKLNDLRSKHMIFLDTVGMSQRDQYIGEHLKVLANSKTLIRPLLLLNATSSGSVLDDVVSVHQKNLNLYGCILTKTDESASLAPVLDILIRRQLQLLFLTNGQRVPEDLYQPNRQYLLHKALKHDPEQTPHSFNDEETPLIMGDSDSNDESAILGIK